MATSVPFEHLFFKAGFIISQKINRLSSEYNNINSDLTGGPIVQCQNASRHRRTDSTPIGRNLGKDAVPSQLSGFAVSNDFAGVGHLYLFNMEEPEAIVNEVLHSFTSFERKVSELKSSTAARLSE